MVNAGNPLGPGPNGRGLDHVIEKPQSIMRKLAVGRLEDA